MQLLLLHHYPYSSDTALIELGQLASSMRPDAMARSFSVSAISSPCNFEIGELKETTNILFALQTVCSPLRYPPACL